ncbi:golvesin C-terminal-like domain-containing protein [Mariniphaga sediminis]|uniref:golvesin C-terminal-like domain-containing protein n=1 Tax=Mariniphaga sediminis TaxID=1628158 RepID=UPI0035666E1E
MISLHNILSIAKYERKTLLRSWFFRIFSVLSLLVLFGLNFGFIIEGGGPDGWAIRSIPAAIPYFNLLILNVAQAIIAVFLASDFLKRDKKLDTTEVIYMRSMTNGEYVIGKTWGNLQVFLVLNIAVILMAFIFNMLSQGTSVNWESYGVYLLLISVPTLVFIMGLSFLLMSVIRNQAITFVIILGYIGITLFLLQAKFYYIFDYMAFNIPMLISDITGMGNLEKVLIHRGIYFSLGASFIFLTIFLLKRLPQSESMTYFSLVFAIAFLGTGGYLGYRHIDQFKQNEIIRTEAIELNNSYVKEQLPVTLAHSISMEHQGKKLAATSTLTLKNENAKPLEKLIFSLNEGLTVKSFKWNGTETPFLRKRHLILVSQDVVLQPGQEAKAEIVYAGNISENLCYLDIPEEERQKKYGKFVLNVDKRYAFLTPHYVLLTSEANWYPTTGVTYSTEDVSWNRPEFINFNLEVKTAPGLQAVSQGEITEISDGRFTFTNNVPLTQISLAIGAYEKKNMEYDSLEYGIWHIKGHDFFTGAFPEIKDTIPQLIGERMGDFERTYNLEYAFDRLFLMEVPVQFKTYERIWSARQEFVQPEQVLIPEKGYLLREADLEGSKKRMERWGRRGNNNMTGKDIEMRILNDFLGLFTEEQKTDFRGRRGGFSVVELANPYFVFPMLYNFQNNIQSEEWPITNRIFEAYLRSQSANIRSGWMRNMQGMSDDELANIALQDSTFEEILADPEQKRIIDNVIKLKGEVLFSMVQWKAGQEEFEDFLRDLLRQYRFKNISFETFDQKIKEKFGIELIPMMDNWFKEKKLPGYLFSPIEAVKVRTQNRMRTKIFLKATNFSEIEGIVKFSFRLGDRGGRGGGFGRGPSADDMINKLVYLEPGQSKDISFMLDADPRMVMLNTMTSQNIPQVITEGFRDIEEDPRALQFEGEVITDIPVKSELSGEIIVDNEDPEFEITQTEKISLLEKWLIKKEEGTRKYEGMNYWRPPVNWTATTNSDFYGEYVRSGYYIKAGDGSMKAKWHVPVTEPGYYDVYYHIYKTRRFGRRGGDEQGEYQFFIHSDDGQEEQTLSYQSADEGWNHLGSYYFSPDTALIELTNKSELRIVFADAMRLVKL